MNEADVYTNLAIQIIETFSATPEELRDWYREEIGTKDARGHAYFEYGLRPAHIYRIEMACRRKVTEYQNWARHLDEIFAGMESTDERSPTTVHARVA